MNNPTQQRVFELTLKGEKMTWGEIKRIRNLLFIESTISHYLKEVKKERPADKLVIAANMDRLQKVQELKSESMHDSSDGKCGKDEVILERKDSQN
jgi:uncharacterized protein YwgA